MSLLRNTKKKPEVLATEKLSLSKRLLRESIDLIKVLAIALFLAWNIRAILFSPYLIPSESMVPTFLVGDYVLVTKYDYGWSSSSYDLLRYYEPQSRLFENMPERGDVIVFKTPSDTNRSEDYIKRLVGLPGDRIQVRGGVLYINRKPVVRRRLEDFTWIDRQGRPRRADQYLETLPEGRSYRIIETRGNRSASDNTPEYLIPPGHLFFMGDNRDESLDSRFDVGFVPMSYVVGKAKTRIFSIGDGAGFLEIWHWPKSVRRDRLLTSINDES